MSESHTDLAIRTDVVAGAAAGDVAVADITENDALKSVVFLDPDGGGAGVSSLADLTDEFSIASDGTINNGGGTATTGGFLLVVWIAADPRGHDLNRN